MSWWNPVDWLLGPQRVYADPVFGRLRCRGRWRWRGEAHFQPVGALVHIAITTGGIEPGDPERSTFLELTRRYDAMRPGIAKALFDLMIRWNEGDWKPTKPDDMLTATLLDVIEIDRSGPLLLYYHFAKGYPFVHEVLSIRVEDWTPIPDNMRD